MHKKHLFYRTSMKFNDEEPNVDIFYKYNILLIAFKRETFIKFSSILVSLRNYIPHHKYIQSLKKESWIMIDMDIKRVSKEKLLQKKPDIPE